MRRLLMKLGSMLPQVVLGNYLIEIFKLCFEKVCVEEVAFHR